LIALLTCPYVCAMCISVV